MIRLPAYRRPLDLPSIDSRMDAATNPDYQPARRQTQERRRPLIAKVAALGAVGLVAFGVAKAFETGWDGVIRDHYQGSPNNPAQVHSANTNP